MDSAASDAKQGGVLGHLEDLSDEFTKAKEEIKDKKDKKKVDEEKIGKDKDEPDVEAGKEEEHKQGKEATKVQD